MILLVAKVSALLALLAVYANNMFHSDSPLFAFFYQPNFIIMLVILFIVGTFFKIIKALFSLALILGIIYYGYSYYTGKSPLEKYSVKAVSEQTKDNDKCGPNSNWYDRLTNHCYGQYMEEQIRDK